MYNTKFVQKLAFAYRNCPLSLEITKHLQAYINSLLRSGIENFPECAVLGRIASHVHSAMMRPVVTDVPSSAWLFVCLSVCWLQPGAVPKRQNQSRCCLGCGLGCVQGIVYWVGGPDAPS